MHTVAGLYLLLLTFSILIITHVITWDFNAIIVKSYHLLHLHAMHLLGDRCSDSRCVSYKPALRLLCPQVGLAQTVRHHEDVSQQRTLHTRNLKTCLDFMTSEPTRWQNCLLFSFPAVTLLSPFYFHAGLPKTKMDQISFTNLKTKWDPPLILWSRSSSKQYFRIQSVPQRKHSTPPPRNSTD
jgi:hypothetical protein